jgi:MFS family permease
MSDPKAAADSVQASTTDEADNLRSELLATEYQKLPEGYFSSWRIVGTFLGIALTLVATYFSLQAGAAVVTFVNADLGPSNNASLYSIVFAMCQPISILIFGRLSDRFGRREFAIGANIVGIVGGIVCATATNMNMLVGGNVLLGLASGPPACYPLLTGELVSNKYKMLGTMVVVVPNVIATGFAPYIGQRLVHVASWRWIYYIYLMMVGRCILV